MDKYVYSGTWPKLRDTFCLKTAKVSVTCRDTEREREGILSVVIQRKLPLRKTIYTPELNKTIKKDKYANISIRPNSYFSEKEGEVSRNTLQ